MPITNYTELQEVIADFLDRDDQTQRIKTFITLAEAEMNRRVRHWRMENRASAVVNGRYSALPSDFLEPIRLHLEADERPIELVSSMEMQTLRNRASAEGKPTSYAITQGEIELYPTPDTDYDLEMYYYGEIPALSAAQTTNPILTYFPDAYLYGSLIHSAPFLGEDARMATWAALFQSAIDGINADNEKAKTGSAGRRIKIRSY
mgnify:CR=1 FL=1